MCRGWLTFSLAAVVCLSGSVAQGQGWISIPPAPTAVPVPPPRVTTYRPAVPAPVVEVEPAITYRPAVPLA